jgi:hypothetical protein
VPSSQASPPGPHSISTGSFNASSHCVRMTMIKHRVCGIRQHENRVNILSILNASVHTISSMMFALPRRDMRHPSTLWHRTFISDTQVTAGRSSMYAMYLSIFPMIITVIFRLMLRQPPAQLEDACRLPQGVSDDASDDIHVRC